MDDTVSVTLADLKAILGKFFEFVADLGVEVQALEDLLCERHGLDPQQLNIAREAVNGSEYFLKARRLLEDFQNAGSVSEFLKRFRGTVQ
jgi:hypothetical protein